VTLIVVCVPVEYDPGMTKRITVSLPDDVAAYLDDAINVSAVVAEALRAHMERAAATEELLRAAGFDITAEGRERLRNHLAPLSGRGPHS
jgi:hypothetical protein